MKFLANENFPFPSINLLKQAGYIVESVSDEYSGISDFQVIEKANAGGLIILTFDKDYGEIVFRHGLEKPPAIIFFRFKGENPETAGELLITLLRNKDLLVENRFTVIEKDGLRQRTYILP